MRLAVDPVRFSAVLCRASGSLCLGGLGPLVPFPMLWCGDSRISCGSRCCLCGYRLFLCGYEYSFTFPFAVPEELRLRCFTEGYVTGALDKLSLHTHYGKVLELEVIEDASKGDPQQAVPGPSTRAQKQPEAQEDPLSKLMSTDDNIKGKVPPQYTSTSAYKGAAKAFSLANTQIVNRLDGYLTMNGGYCMESTPKDGSCLFSSMRWATDMPLEYVIPLFRRDIVMFLVENADFFYPMLEVTIRGTYGGKRLTREAYLQKTKDGTITPVEEMEYNYPGPFSYASYLKYMLLESSWGDEVILCVVSMMWQLKITVLHAESLHETRIRHNVPLEEADMVVVYCSGAHYIGAGKCGYRII